MKKVEAMEDPIEICKSKVNTIFKLITELLELNGENPIARNDRQSISNFEVNYKNFISRISASSIDIEAAISSAKGVAVHAQSLGLGIRGKSSYTEEVKSTAKTLSDFATDFANVIDSSKEFTGPYILSVKSIDQLNTTNNELDSISDHEKKIIELQAKFRSEVEAFERDISKGANEIEQLRRRDSDNIQKTSNELSALRDSIEQLKSSISGLHKNMEAESGKANKISEDAAEYTKGIHSRIDELLGQTASKVLLVDYANTADSEKKSANRMRFFSLSCMTLTGLILCFALYESLHGELDWKQAIFKAFTAIALSIPAAYLARESAKHRNQEHINRRISLDLRAIDPYIATLQTEEQNKIKIEVASKIFGTQESANAVPDNYPLNIQELVKLIIEKIPTQK